MSNLTASLIIGSVVQDINSNPPHKESPPRKESNLLFRNPPSKERSTSPAKNTPSTESNISDHTYDPDNILPNEMKLLLGVGNQQLSSKMREENGEDTSNTNPLSSLFEEAHEDSSSVTVTSSQTETSNPNDGTGDGDGDKFPF
ncbi:hypothetical protein P9112_002226 [Eukaryota sp. TZLM1-RC]